MFLDLSTDSNGIVDSSSVVGFNPQPEPPGIADAGVFGMSFDFTALSEPTVALSVLDAQGNTISFSEVRVPEPPALTLFGLGLLALGAARWRQRREPRRHPPVSRSPLTT